MKRSRGISTHGWIDDSSAGFAFTKKTVKKYGLPHRLTSSVKVGAHATDRPVQDDYKFPVLGGFMSCNGSFYGDFLTDKGLP